jgi:hypothetical protein
MKYSLIGLLSMLSLLIGCQAPRGAGAQADRVTSTKVEADNSLPDGWKRVEAKGEKLSIGYPPDWKALDLTQADFAKEMDSAGLQDPEMVADAKKLAQNKGFKLMVAHAPEGDFRPNLNVLVIDAPGATFDEAKRENLDQLKGLSKTPPVESDIVMDGNQAVEFKSEMAMPTVKEPIDVDSYIFLKNNKEYVLTISAIKGSPTESSFDGIVKTLKVG